MKAMNILVAGATGFIASQIVTDLMAAGHSVTCCVRDVSYAKKLFPAAHVIYADFDCDISSESWLPRLSNIDVVINCVGILYHPRTSKIWNIHYHTPRALFDACVLAGVSQVIQMSALGIDQSKAEFAKSKLAADDYLQSLPVKNIILRPSLVYGHGSYGGTSLFRGLAGLPFVVPVPGTGGQQFQPVHLQDLSRSILKLIAAPPDHNMILCAVGPECVSFLDIIKQLRSWLGFAKAGFLFIPLRLMNLAAWLGDLLPYTVMNSTSYAMLLQNNYASEDETRQYQQQAGFIPRDFKAGIYSQPSVVQDRWHARLYFLKPTLQMTIAFIWLYTAACSLFFYPHAASYYLLAQTGIPGSWQPILLYGSALLDGIIGLAMVCSYRLRQVCLAQIGLILVYTAIISWKLPYLWLEPFAPVAKNLPLLAAILVLMGMESDR
jgi:nucleoside-diphosphate-sugar epimerase